MRTFVVNIPENEFNTAAMSFDSAHYTKTTMYGQLKKTDGFSYVTCGVKDDEKLVATALILIKKIPYLFSCYCYVTYGYSMDYSDVDLLHFFNQEICAYCKDTLKATFLRIDPNFPVFEHEKDGKMKEGGFNRQWFTDALVEDGFRHLGYNYGYSGNWMSRYTYILDLSPELKTIQKNIKNYNNHMRKNTERCLEVYEGTKDDLDILYKAELDLAKKDRFIPKNRDYFEQQFECFKDYCHLYIAKADLGKAYQTLKNQYETLLNTDDSKMSVQRKKEREAQMASLEKEIDAMEKEGYPHMGEKLLGAKFIIQIGDHVSNVNMYTFKILQNFRTALALHGFAISECKGRDAKKYDFEGISGSLDKKDQFYGLYDFKRSFGGDFIEYPGEFDAIFNEKKYAAFKKYDRLIRRWRRRFYLVLKGWF